MLFKSLHPPTKSHTFSATVDNLSSFISVADWLVCWTQTLSDNSLRQTVHTHWAPVHQAAKLVAALLRVAKVTVGLAQSNGSLPPARFMTQVTCRLTA